MPKSENTIISFDLDNTLINNRKGIVRSFNYALKKFNLPEVSKSVIEEMIGLPLNDMFAKFTELDPSKLSYTFREYYVAKGIYQSKLLPGVKNKLKELREFGFQLGVITSKKQEIAIKIAEYLKIDGFFDYILGESDRVKSKLDPNLKLILSEEYPGSNIIIIGDHPKDALLSKNLSTPFIGVLTGSHTENSLREARENSELTLILKSVKQISIGMILALLIKNS
ncbi:MAG: HAD hydrolase-like protein [Candidatus Lokiarchaeota archaeon]|nr:HAD hydrolase-like protein [Candidatus Lokiarchaeota archaeon]